MPGPITGSSASRPPSRSSRRGRSRCRGRRTGRSGARAPRSPRLPSTSRSWASIPFTPWSNGAGGVVVGSRLLVLDQVALRRVEEGDALGHVAAGAGRRAPPSSGCRRPRCAPGWSARSRVFFGLYSSGRLVSWLTTTSGSAALTAASSAGASKTSQTTAVRPGRPHLLGFAPRAVSCRSPRGRPRPAAAPAAARSPRSLPRRTPSCPTSWSQAPHPFHPQAFPRRAPARPRRGRRRRSAACRTSRAPRSSLRPCRRRG